MIVWRAVFTLARADRSIHLKTLVPFCWSFSRGDKCTTFLAMILQRNRNPCWMSSSFGSQMNSTTMGFNCCTSCPHRMDVKTVSFGWVCCFWVRKRCCAETVDVAHPLQPVELRSFDEVGRGFSQGFRDYVRQDCQRFSRQRSRFYQSPQHQFRNKCIKATICGSFRTSYLREIKEAISNMTSKASACAFIFWGSNSFFCQQAEKYFCFWKSCPNPLQQTNKSDQQKMVLSKSAQASVHFPETKPKPKRSIGSTDGNKLPFVSLQNPLFSQIKP